MKARESRSDVHKKRDTIEKIREEIADKIKDKIIK